MDSLEIYNNLYQQWIKEIKEEEITLFTNVVFKEYLKLYTFDYSLNRNIKKSEIEDIKNSLIASYNKNVKYLLDDLLNVRKRKIINKALNLIEINKGKLLEHEQMFYDNLISSFKGYKNLKTLTVFDIESSLKSRELSLKEVVETSTISSFESNFAESSSEQIPISGIDYINLRFLVDCPALVGIDLSNYGPFKKEDVCSLPKENAKILVEEKIAEKINVS